MIDKDKAYNGSYGLLIWFTGLSGSGKTTLAEGVKSKLEEQGIKALVLDGDTVRNGLNKDLGFSDRDRSENIRRAGEISKLLVDAGFIVIGAFISPFKKDRDFLRTIIKRNRFIEIFVDCDLTTCENRDIKGLYNKARVGKIKEFTGISSRYEKPESPEIHIQNGSGFRIKDNVEFIYNYVIKYHSF